MLILELACEALQKEIDHTTSEQAIERAGLETEIACMARELNELRDRLDALAIKRAALIDQEWRAKEQRRDKE